MRALSRRLLFALPLAVPAVIAAKQRVPFMDWPVVARYEFKPFLIGRCINVEPMLIDETACLFQVNDGPVDEITDVRSADACMGFGATRDYPTLAELGAAPLDVDEYATCLAEGVFRIGSRPGFPIRVDAATDAEAVFGRFSNEEA